ncbi:hypothetical protein GCM10009662_10120 [Catellatospora coxensis]|uniref:Uncharacterized protein n=1 Tax=Catellatospora coxensis TaxID=310354 RepID=A0A8J3P7F9_9ACTN|nr:hypothetical protein Cco03nite_37360 [Catellatospora coxensis]
MRLLTAEQFATYARRQIKAADGILADHGRSWGNMCGCGRLWPCPVAATCVRMREHFLTRLALVEATVRLPVVRPGPVPEPVVKADARWLPVRPPTGELGESALGSERTFSGST